METQLLTIDTKGCNICINPYDCTERRPRSLPCGHSFCSQCISTYVKEKKVICPNCRREHKASASTDFPINYELESFMQEYHTPGQQTTELISKISSDALRGISKKLKSVRHEFTSDMEALSNCSQEFCSQLYQYKSQLMEWREQHQYNLEEHRDIVQRSEDMIICINKESVRVDETIEEGKEKGKQMKTICNNLTAASTSHEVTTTLNEADFYYSNLDRWTKKVEKHFPDSKLVIQSQQLKEQSEFGLRKYSSCIDEEDAVAFAPEEAVDQCQNISLPSSKEEASPEDPTEDEGEDGRVLSSSTIQERIQKAFDNMPVQQVTQTVQTHRTAALEVGDLVNMTPMAKQLLESDRVFAVKEVKEEIRYARITLDQNHQLCLHVLGKPQCLPHDAFCLQHDDVMRLVDPFSRLTFLELAIEGRSSLGRLLIRLFHNTKSTQQFSILCTGEMGHSYTDTNIMFVANKGDDAEHVVFGDNAVCSSKALLPGFDWKEEKNKKCHVRPWVAGNVSFFCVTEDHDLPFFIFTRDRPKRNSCGIFGVVEDGMSILTEAVSQYPDIDKCFIRDSGIVLNL